MFIPLYHSVSESVHAFAHSVVSHSVNECTNLLIRCLIQLINECTNLLIPFSLIQPINQCTLLFFPLCLIQLMSARICSFRCLIQLINECTNLLIPLCLIPFINHCTYLFIPLSHSVSESVHEFAHSVVSFS